MNWGLVVSAVVVMVGWWAVHKLNSARDLSIKRRDTRVHYLIEAYRRVEAVASRGLGEGPVAEDVQRQHNFEDALGDIQLLGDKEQVQLAIDVVRRLASPDQKADMDPLLISLRRDLRRELQLPQVDEKPLHLRIKQKRSEGP